MSDKKKPLWRNEFGMTLPFCPKCEEPLYEEDKCVFCGQEIDYCEPENLKKGKVVEYENIQITQVYGSWGVYVVRDNKLISHLAYQREMSDEELLDLAKSFGLAKEKLENDK